MADVTSPAEQVEALAHRIAEAIGRRDVGWLKVVLAPGFVHRTAAGDASDADSFLEVVAAIQADILSVTLEALTIDVADFGALATGVQVARVRVNGDMVEDKRRFADWFVKVGGEWRLRVAIDLGKQRAPAHSWTGAPRSCSASVASGSPSPRETATRTSPPPNGNYGCSMDHLLRRASHSSEGPYPPGPPRPPETRGRRATSAPRRRQVYPGRP